MDVIAGQIATTSRLTKQKEDNIKHVTEEIYKLINDKLTAKLQEVCDFICLRYISVIDKKEIRLKIPKTFNKIIELKDISKLQSGDLMDGSIIIKLSNNVTIEYVCPSSKDCIQQIINSLTKNRKKLVLITSDTPTHTICKISVK